MTKSRRPLYGVVPNLRILTITTIHTTTTTTIVSTGILELISQFPFVRFQAEGHLRVYNNVAALESNLEIYPRESDLLKEL